MGEELERGAADEAERLLRDSNGFVEILDRVTKAMADSGVPYLFIGGLASAVLGRYRHTVDIDILVHPNRARETLDSLQRAGFETEETFPHWLFKARSDGWLVDVLFRSEGDIYLDPEMIDHSVTGEYEGRTIQVVGPEDLVVMKALAHAEETPRHWFDSLGILGNCEIDWEYLLHRARRGPARVLSLLAYAVSKGLSVPGSILEDLLRLTDPPRR
ncbi:MAG TPA: nucleotidyl transferase AbiEii/AbiGii toxin family protein [Acidimicrobiia bacterium]|jgi:predicted nucleotidyltransferase